MDVERRGGREMGEEKGGRLGGWGGGGKGRNRKQKDKGDRRKRGGNKTCGKGIE